jgi:hypothetical protein
VFAECCAGKRLHCFRLGWSTRFRSRSSFLSTQREKGFDWCSLHLMHSTSPHSQVGTAYSKHSRGFCVCFAIRYQRIRNSISARHAHSLQQRNTRCRANKLPMTDSVSVMLFPCRDAEPSLLKSGIVHDQTLPVSVLRFSPVRFLNPILCVLLVTAQRCAPDMQELGLLSGSARTSSVPALAQRVR